MLDGIQQHFPIHYVDVEVLTAFDIRFVVEIPIQQADKVGFTYWIFFAQRRRTMEKVYEIPSLA